MESTTIINYAFWALVVFWSLAMLIISKNECAIKNDSNALKKGVSTYVFGLLLIFAGYFSLTWAMLG